MKLQWMELERFVHVLDVKQYALYPEEPTEYLGAQVHQVVLVHHNQFYVPHVLIIFAVLVQINGMQVWIAQHICDKWHWKLAREVQRFPMD